ncbi:Plant invertase/pectin methylesterase inhibitor superfamily protein [Euphorbia peplus]|nr:Plant invertase/pectin methylesterase inhibitor superfamily protein [Euphorbia peplus]
MESINVLKGYGKVNSSNLESQTTHPPTNRKSIIAISAVLLLTLIVSLIIAAAIFDFNSGTDLDSAESIRSVCNVTRYPDSCVATISTANPSVKADPEAIFKVSIEVSIKEVKNVSSQFRALNSQAAVDDCLSMFDDALSKLNDSLAIMESALTEMKINDVQTWISAAMTYQQTCLDGLEEMGSTVPEEIKGQLGKCNEVLSNSLAIVAKMHTLVHQFHLKLH